VLELRAHRPLLRVPRLRALCQRSGGALPHLRSNHQRPCKDFPVNINFDCDQTADRLVSLGYQPTETYREFSGDGSTRRDWAVQTMRPMRLPNGEAPDFTPPQNCAVLTFGYTSELWPERFSKVASKFADALVSLLATPDGPLVRRTARNVGILYRLEGVVAPRLDDLSVNHSSELYPHGLMARDLNAVLVLCAGSPEVPVADTSEWLGGRSPLTVARTSLPEIDPHAASVALAALVDKFVAAGDMEVNGRYVEPARTTTQHSELSIDVDPVDWDPMDPKRKSPGLAERVRELRSKLMGGTPSRRIDNDELRGRLDAQREAARGPGIYAPWLD
jgi:hypothetical protein